MVEPMPPSAPDDPAPSLTATVVAGLRWSYVSTLLVAALQIGVTAVLARLLTPSVFGLVAMAGLFLRFGQYFAQMGAGQAVVQRPVLEERDVHTAFTSAAVLGVAFALLFAAGAPLAVYLFPGTPGVVAVTRVMAITFLLGGLTATTQGLLRRRFAFRAIALTEIGTYVVGYALIGLVLAASGAGVWSLVVASLAQAALAAAVYIVLCRRQLGVALAPQSLRSIYSYGGRISIIGFVEFIATNLDTLWAGHFFGAAATGLYSRARNLAIVPLYQFTTSLSRVLLPAYSSVQREPERLKTIYLTGATLLASIVVPVAWGVAGAAREVIVTLLGDQWMDAVPLLTVMSLAMPFMLLMHLGALLCEAVAALRVRIALTFARLAWVAVLLGVIGRHGILGVAVAFAVSELLTHLAYLQVMRRLLGVTVHELWLVHSVGLGAGITSLLVLFGIHAGLAATEMPAALVLLTQILAGTIILLAAVTRARGGAVWKEARSRMEAAGLRLDGGVAAPVVRTLDRLSGHPY